MTTAATGVDTSALAPRPDDPHAVAITRRAILTLLGSTITPDAISRRAWELDDADARPRGVSTYTLRNNQACSALLERFRTFKQTVRRRNPTKLPAHILLMEKPALIRGLLRERSVTVRLETALDRVAVQLHGFGHAPARKELAPHIGIRAALAASRLPGQAPAALTEEADREAARSRTLAAVAIAAIPVRPVTVAAALRNAIALDPDGRGLHPDIFERNHACAALLAAANGRPAPSRCTEDMPKALVRLGNYQLGLALTAERAFAKALKTVTAKATDLLVDLQLPDLLRQARADELRYRREQLQLQRDLIDAGLA